MKLLKGENEKVIVVIKDELSRKLMKNVVGLRAKIYSYLKDDGSEDKSKKHRKVFHKNKM